MNHFDQSTSQENSPMNTSEQNPCRGQQKSQENLSINHLSRKSFKNEENQLQNIQEIEMIRIGCAVEQQYVQPEYKNKRIYFQSNCNMKADQQYDGAPKVMQSTKKNGNIQNSAYKNQQDSWSRSQKNKKKGSQTIFSGFDLSFEDRISIQTMDSKQFSAYCQSDQKQLIDIVDELNTKNSNQFKANKDYFDYHIIEKDDQDGIQENFKQEELINHQEFLRNQQKQLKHESQELKNGEQISRVQIQLQQDYQNSSTQFKEINRIQANLKNQEIQRPQQNQNYQRNQEHQANQLSKDSYFPQDYFDTRKNANQMKKLNGFDQNQLQYIHSKKQRQLKQLTAACKETQQQNQILQKRIKQLQDHFQQILFKKKYNTDKKNQETIKKYQKSLEYLRKFSL